MSAPPTLSIILILAIAFPQTALGKASLTVGHDNLAPSGPSLRAGKKKRSKWRHQRRRRSRRRYVQLTGSPGLHVHAPWRAWGTRNTIERLKEVGAAYAARFPEAPPIWVHDISKRWGGPMRPHKSHRYGRDVDIRVFLKRHTERYVRARPWSIHAERMWFLIKTLVNTCDVELIFLDRRLQRVLFRYARKQGDSQLERRGIFRGFVRHVKGHDDHIHVRFKKRRFGTLVAKCYCESMKVAAAEPVFMGDSDVPFDIITRADAWQTCVSSHNRAVRRRRARRARRENERTAALQAGVGAPTLLASR